MARTIDLDDRLPGQRGEAENTEHDHYDKPYEDIHYHGTGRDPDPEERFTG